MAVPAAQQAAPLAPSPVVAPVSHDWIAQAAPSPLEHQLSELSSRVSALEHPAVKYPTVQLSGVFQADGVVFSQDDANRLPPSAGGVGLPPGIALGVAIAYVLNLAMMPSFGHPVDFHLHPVMVFATLAGAIVIVLIAAIIPARRAANIDVVEALHYE